MTAVIAWSLTWLMHSTIVLGAVALFSRWSRPHDRVRDMAWRAAIVIPFLTATWQSVGVTNTPFALELAASPALTETAADRIAPDLLAPEAAVLPAPLQSAAGRPVTPDALIEGAEAGPIQHEKLQTSSPLSFSDWVTHPGPARAIITLLIIAVALVSVRTLRSAHALRRLLRDRKHVRRGALHEAYEYAVRRMPGMAPVRLTESPTVAAPIALGIVRREICVPVGIEKRLDHAALQSVLAHELAHHQRRDPLWLPLVDALARCVFFQPLLHLAAKELRGIAEFRCDAIAAERIGDPVGLARSLTEVAEWIIDAAPLSRRALGIAPAPSVLHRRVTRLLETSGAPRSNERRIGPASAAITVALTLGMTLALYGPGWRAATGDTNAAPRNVAVNAEVRALRNDLDALDAEIAALRTLHDPAHTNLIHALELQSQTLRRQADACASASAANVDHTTPPPSRTTQP